ncbi:MAG: ferrochelatase [Limisphaerales bacterium]
MSKAILLVNLGSPDSPSVPDVRRYLNEFLMDGRVIDAPWLVRRFVVGMILINRPEKSRAMPMKKSGTKEGSATWSSPAVMCRSFCKGGFACRWKLAMRYQNPSIKSAVKKLAAGGATEVLLIPLFPHYAMSSYETAVVRVQEVVTQLAPQMKLVVQPPYYDQPDYIAALVASAPNILRRTTIICCSAFMAIPERHIKKSDTTGCHCLATPNCCETPSPAHAQCYRAQCYRTAAYVH